MSPDGRLLAFTGRMKDDTKRLWIRALDGVTPQVLPGTEDAALPFFSPDGHSIGFFAQDTLKRIDLPGNAVRVICDLPHPRRPAEGGGGTWNASDVIIFAPASYADRLYRVLASGGRATPLTALNTASKEETHTVTVFLP
jgi:hypothetical protein